jgi:hypothetical protein
MSDDIEIVSVEQDSRDGMVVTVPDATIGACVVEELLELRPRPRLTYKVDKQNPAKTEIQDSIDGARGMRRSHVVPNC